MVTRSLWLPLVFSALVNGGGCVVASPRIWEPARIGSFGVSDGLTVPTDPQALPHPPLPSLSGSLGALALPPPLQPPGEAGHIQTLETQLGLSPRPS